MTSPHGCVAVVATFLSFWCSYNFTSYIPVDESHVIYHLSTLVHPTYFCVYFCWLSVMSFWFILLNTISNTNVRSYCLCKPELSLYSFEDNLSVWKTITLMTHLALGRFSLSVRLSAASALSLSPFFPRCRWYPRFWHIGQRLCCPGNCRRRNKSRRDVVGEKSQQPWLWHTDGIGVNFFECVYFLPISHNTSLLLSTRPAWGGVVGGGGGSGWGAGYGCDMIRKGGLI